MIKIDIDMPECCDKCFALDERGDYPFCLISQDSRGYNFNIREQRMPSCPLMPLEDARTPCSDCQEWTCDNCSYISR